MELKEWQFPCLWKLLLLFYIKAFPSVMMYWETEKEIFHLCIKTHTGSPCFSSQFLLIIDVSSRESPPEITLPRTFTLTHRMYNQPSFGKICFWRYLIFLVKCWIVSPPQKNSYVDDLSLSTLQCDVFGDSFFKEIKWSD